MLYEIEPTQARSREAILKCSSMSSIVFGVWVLLGWTLDNEFVKQVIPGQVVVKANVAICLIFLGSTVAVLKRRLLLFSYRRLLARVALGVSLSGNGSTVDLLGECQ